MKSNIIKFSNPKKVLFPQDNITKEDILAYYNNISDHMLPFMKDRLLSMERFPNGIDGESFFQKDAQPYFPDFIKTVNIPKKDGGVTHYVVGQNKETLLYLANLACLTFHLWLSKIKKLDYPDRLIFDLDPHDANQFEIVRSNAFKFKEILENLGLTPYPMLTGSKGLHIVIPIRPTYTYDTVKNFAKNCAKLLLASNPKELTLELRKNKRDNKIFIDTFRNEYSATAVAPFSIRPKPKAPIATPITWEELANKKIVSQSFNINNIFKRLEKIDDPWPDFNKAQGLTRAIKKISQL